MSKYTAIVGPEDGKFSIQGGPEMYITEFKTFGLQEEYLQAHLALNIPFGAIQCKNPDGSITITWGDEEK